MNATPQMAIDRVVKGDASKTVILRRIAVGTVTEVGLRTAKITCSDQAEPVTSGMKVLPGNLPESVTFSEIWIHDISRGL